MDYFRTSMFGTFTYINVDGYAFGFERTPGELAKDPTHSGTFRAKFSEICDARGISCRFGHHDALIALLAEDSSKGGKEKEGR